MSEYKKIMRRIFRTDVFIRDGYRCVICGAEDGVVAHHITDGSEMPNDGLVRENGITLCPNHHLLAEMWHKSLKQEFWDGFHPNDLYKKINSSYELAVLKSKELK